MRIGLIGLDAGATDREVVQALVDRYNTAAKKAGTGLTRMVVNLQAEADAFPNLIADAMVKTDDGEEAIAAAKVAKEAALEQKALADADVLALQQRVSTAKRDGERAASNLSDAHTQLLQNQQAHRHALNLLQRHNSNQAKVAKRLGALKTRIEAGMPYPEEDENVGYFLALIDRRAGITVIDRPTFLEVSFRTKRITRTWAETSEDGTWPIDTYFPRLSVRIRLNQGNVSRHAGAYITPFIDEPVDLLTAGMDYFMPHANSGGSLCCGSTGSSELLDHMSDGRWLDAAILVCHLLSHYNHADPYLALSNWTDCHTDEDECPCGRGAPHTANACRTPRCFVCADTLPSPKPGQTPTVAHTNCLRTEAKRQGNPFPDAKGICGQPIFPDLLGSADTNLQLTQNLGGLLERLKTRYERNQNRDSGRIEVHPASPPIQAAGHGSDDAAGPHLQR